jgi:hypothetical protein
MMQYVQGQFVGANPCYIKRLRILRNTTLMQSPSWNMTPLIAGLLLSDLATELQNLSAIRDSFLAHLILIFGWSLVNLRVIPGLKAFDPFPFGVLALVVSSESVV